MRIIQARPKKVIRQRNPKLSIIFLIFVVSLLATGYYFYYKEVNYRLASDNQQTMTPRAVEKKIRTFNGNELKDLYNKFHYVNTNKIINEPVITGNEVADSRIRSLAEARGYRLRRIARSTIDVDGYQVQPLVEEPWANLARAAKKDGIILTITSGFRDIDEQKEYFLEALNFRGIDARDIANGLADAQVSSVLETVAPPGYSRHHTGFTIDLTCGTNGLTNFATTACYDWLSRDNHLNAKTYGWAPSYPSDASLQGPNPEPWEYVWLTIDSLIE